MHNTQYLHIRTNTNNGGVTIGYSFNDETESIEVAYARCHNDDRYVKRTGRLLVDERLKNNQHFLITFADVVNFVKDNIHSIIHRKIPLDFINTINDVSGMYINDIVYSAVVDHIRELHYSCH